MGSFKERAEQYKKQNPPGELIAEATGHRDPVNARREKGRLDARSEFVALGLNTFLEEAQEYLRDQHDSQAVLDYDHSTSSSRPDDSIMPTMPESIYVAELRWGFEYGISRNGCKFVRLELSRGHQILKVFGKIHGKEIVWHVNPKSIDQSEVTIVNAVFNPGYRPPINGPHPENL